jgi:iron complex outermembrane receptor protein
VKQHQAYAFVDDKLRMRVSSEFERSDGGRLGGSLLRPLDDDYCGARVNVHAIYDLDVNDTLTLSAGSNVADGVSQPPASGGFGILAESHSESSYVMAQWRHEVSRDNYFTLTTYVNDFHVRPGFELIDYRYQQLAFQFSHTFEPAEDHTFTWGIDNRTDNIDSSNSHPGFLKEWFIGTNIFGIYGQDEWRFAPRWKLSLGGRIDYENYGGFEPSGRAALAYELSETSNLYGAVSRAFTMPNAAIRKMYNPEANGLIVMSADEDLAAQSLIAYELGYRGSFFDRIDAGVNLFYNDYSDVAAFVPRLGPPGLLFAQMRNVGGVAVYGIELDAQYAITDQLGLLGHYTYQQYESSLELPLYFADMMTPPRHKFTVGVRYDVTEDLHLSSHLHYVDDVAAPDPDMLFFAHDVDEYFRLDLRAEYELWDDQASVAIGVSNLLDDDHFEGSSLLINKAQVPRFVYAEFRLSIR